MPAPLTSGSAHNQQRSQCNPPKNVKHKASKPIINWIQRKLGGTARARRTSDPQNASPIGGHGRVSNSDSTFATRATSPKEFHASTLTAPGSRGATGDIIHTVRGHGHRSLSNEISLNSMDDIATDEEEDGLSNGRSSGAGVSMWGSRSNPVEADEDASIRPLPPTSPPSPSPSRSSSSYLSDPRTFKSLSISTKPTTLLSIDISPMGMAHIAQAPPTPTSISPFNSPGTSPVGRISNHLRSPSNGPTASTSIFAFSNLPPSSPPSSRPSSVDPNARPGLTVMQAPTHTTHHPRNNPRPSSPPLDNASILTLASSAFATPFSERRGYGHTLYAHGWSNGDSASHLSQVGVGNDSVFLDDLAIEEQNPSVRALRPRSARRDSWDSEISRWSAGMSVLGMLTAGRERSVRTAPSWRTGCPGTMDIDDTGSVSGDECCSAQDETRNEGDDFSRARSPFPRVSFENGKARRLSETTEIEAPIVNGTPQEAIVPTATAAGHVRSLGNHTQGRADGAINEDGETLSDTSHECDAKVKPADKEELRTKRKDNAQRLGVPKSF